MTKPTFNPFNRHPVATTIVAKRFPLRTEKLIGSEWVHVASFPAALDLAESAGRERLGRHAVAFGGQVRLLKGDVLLAEWEDGELVEDWRECA
jgi:hypothetical protein